ILQQSNGVETVARREDTHAVAFEQALRHAADGDGVIHHHDERAAIGLFALHRLRAAAPLGTHERSDVENDDDAAVAQDRGAGDAADRGHLRAHGLHDDLAAAYELIRDE